MHCTKCGAGVTDKMIKKHQSSARCWAGASRQEIKKAEMAGMEASIKKAWALHLAGLPMMIRPLWYYHSGRQATSGAPNRDWQCALTALVPEWASKLLKVIESDESVLTTGAVASLKQMMDDEDWYDAVMAALHVGDDMARTMLDIRKPVAEDSLTFPVNMELSSEARLGRELDAYGVEQPRYREMRLQLNLRVPMGFEDREALDATIDAICQDPRLTSYDAKATKFDVSAGVDSLNSVRVFLTAQWEASKPRLVPDGMKAVEMFRPVEAAQLACQVVSDALAADVGLRDRIRRRHRAVSVATRNLGTLGSRHLDSMTSVLSALLLEKFPGDDMESIMARSALEKTLKKALKDCCSTGRYGMDRELRSFVKDAEKELGF